MTSAALIEETEFFSHAEPLTVDSLTKELQHELNQTIIDQPNNVPKSYHFDTDDIGDVPLKEAQKIYSHFYKRVQRTNDDILNALKRILKRYERDDDEDELIHEWRLVALGVDRILFWVFVFGTLSSTTIVLIVAPIMKWF